MWIISLANRDEYFMNSYLKRYLQNQFKKDKNINWSLKTAVCVKYDMGYDLC